MTTDVVGMMGSFAFQWLALKCSTSAHTQVQLHNILHKQTLRLQRMGWGCTWRHQSMYSTDRRHCEELRLASVYRLNRCNTYVAFLDCSVHHLPV